MLINHKQTLEEQIKAFYEHRVDVSLAYKKANEFGTKNPNSYYFVCIDHSIQVDGLEVATQYFVLTPQEVAEAPVRLEVVAFFHGNNVYHNHHRETPLTLEQAVSGL